MTIIDVADAEDVVDRRATTRRGEDVAEEARAARRWWPAEFVKSPALCAMPAASIASGSAGMTPPLVGDGGEVQRAAERDRPAARGCGGWPRGTAPSRK